MAIVHQSTSALDLSDDCWECIFQFLSTDDKIRLGQVSTLCSRVLRFPGSWPIVDLHGRATDNVLRMMFGVWKLRPAVVDLSDSPISDAGLAALADCKSLTSLDLTRCVQVSDTGVASIAQLPIKALSLFCCRRISDSALAILAATPLETLNLISCKLVTDNGLAHLQRSTRLKSLNLSGCAISDEGVRHLEALPLRILHLSRCPISDRSLRALRALPLQVLHLVGTSITASGLRHLRSVPLKRLYLNQCRKLSEKSITRRLAGCALEKVVLPSGATCLGPLRPCSPEPDSASQDGAGKGQDLLTALEQGYGEE